MPDALDKFLGEINRDKLRVKRPSKFVFLCGGLIHPDKTAIAVNLRDFIWRRKSIGQRGTAYVLAESAQQLYRDSGYKDLITFEEDIARIAAVVLVISESAGSLAELGAFSSNTIIKPVLRILVSETNFGQESFIRWGPIERVLTPVRDRVGVFHWLDSDPVELEKSAEPLFLDIEKFINDHVATEPATLAYPNDTSVSVFYDIMWAIYLADAITISFLLEIVQRVHKTLTLSELKRKLYTLRVARWVDIKPFGGQDYYFLTEQADPFQYGFHVGVDDKEPTRKALAVRRELIGNIPDGALTRVRDTRAANL